MIPVLLPEAWAGTLGQSPQGIIGFLSEATSCTVSEELNGEFSLSMTYPISGHLTDSIVAGAQILAKYNENDAELFRITRVTTTHQTVTVYAPHISYDLNKVTVFPFTASGRTAAAEKLQGPTDSGAAMWDHGFEITGAAAGGSFTVDKPASVRSIMAGNDNSIAGVFGGEWLFWGRLCEIFEQRGNDLGVAVRYGGNLTSYQQEENIAEMYNGIAPIATYNNSTRTLSEGYIMASGIWTRKNILPVDLSSEFSGSLPTEAQLRSKATAYIRTHRIGVPEVSLTVGVKDFTLQNPNAQGWTLELGDSVTVIFPKLNVYTKARINKITYDVLREAITSADIGTKKTGIYETILNLGKPSELALIPSGWQEADTQPTKFFAAYAAGTSGTYFGRTAYRLYNSSGDYYAYYKSAYSNTYSGWRLYDNSTATGYATSSSDTAPFVGIRMAKRLRYVTISIANRTGSESTNVNGPKAGIIYGANAESDTLVEVARFSGWDGKTAGKVNSITLLNETPYYAYLIDVTDWENRTRTNNHYMAIGEVYLNGQEEA